VSWAEALKGSPERGPSDSFLEDFDRSLWGSVHTVLRLLPVFEIRRGKGQNGKSKGGFLRSGLGLKAHIYLL